MIENTEKNKLLSLVSGISLRSEFYPDWLMQLQWTKAKPSGDLPLPVYFALAVLIEFINLIVVGFKFFIAKNKNLGKTFDLIFSMIATTLGLIATTAFCFSLLSLPIVGSLFLAAIAADTLYKLGQFFYHLCRYYRTPLTSDRKAFFSYLCQRYGIASLDGLVLCIGIVALVAVPIFFSLPIWPTIGLVMLGYSLAESIIFLGVLGFYWKKISILEKIDFISNAKIINVIAIGVLLAATIFLSPLAATTVQIVTCIFVFFILKKIKKKYSSPDIPLDESLANSLQNRQDIAGLSHTVENQIGFDYYFSEDRTKNLSNDFDKNRNFLQGEILKKVILLDQQITNNRKKFCFFSEMEKREEKYNFLLNLLVSQLYTDKKIAENEVQVLIQFIPQGEKYKKDIMNRHEEINRQISTCQSKWKKIDFEEFKKNYVKRNFNKAFQSFFRKTSDVEDIYMAVAYSFQKTTHNVSI